MLICLLVLYILSWLTRYLNLDTSLVYISKWEYTLCCVWHFSWTWSVQNIRMHLKLDSSFWIWVSAFVNHIHIWQWNTSLSSFWRYIKTLRMFYKDSYRNTKWIRISLPAQMWMLIVPKFERSGKMSTPTSAARSQVFGRWKLLSTHYTDNPSARFPLLSK